MKKLLLLSLLLLPVSCLVPEKTEKIITESPKAEEPLENISEFCCIETMPSFPGGLEAMKKYFNQAIKYPEYSLCISGKVFVSFSVSETGKISEVKVVKGLTPAFDDEAIKGVAGMPNWIPGRQCEKPVKMKCTLPINFSLE
ncbi:MAG: TonB family protein [Verrucomicrobia bacterium]|nr:TonB family protein [Cytophagales bacterium]